MKLSEAIRLGAMLHPQAFGKMLDRDSAGRVQATCAIAAAIQAGYYALEDNEGELDAPCPACGGCLPYSHDRNSLISHLNDQHRWTRERIANWIEGLEQAQEQPASTDAVDPAVRDSTS